MKKNRRSRNYTLIIVIVSLLIIGLLEYKGIIWHNSLFAYKYEVRGIDVARYQGDVDWDKVAGSGNYHFVYIKATEGQDFTDRYFEQNWQAANDTELLVGAYHFFTTQSTGEEQARHFINTVPNNKIQLPPVIDIEIALDKDAAEIRNELTVMSDILELHYEQKPILYVTYNTFNTYIGDEFADHEIWIRDIVKHPSLKNNREWTFWQYNNRGRIAGIDAYVDINVYRGDLASFEHKFMDRK